MTSSQAHHGSRASAQFGYVRARSLSAALLRFCFHPWRAFDFTFVLLRFVAPVLRYRGIMTVQATPDAASCGRPRPAAAANLVELYADAIPLPGAVASTPPRAGS
jgi:hypothetical protein